MVLPKNTPQGSSPPYTVQPDENTALLMNTGHEEKVGRLLSTSRRWQVRERSRVRVVWRTERSPHNNITSKDAEQG